MRINKIVGLFVLCAAVNVAAQETEGAQKSAEEIAAELANPNTPMASLNLKLQYRSFEGTLPGADSQSSTTLFFQPSFPFPLDSGDVILFRPGIPIQLDFAFPDSSPSGFGSESGIGDIAFDLAYARTTKTGMLYAGGLIASPPTATDDALGTDRYTLGPEFMVGKLTKKSVLGIFPNHQWGVVVADNWRRAVIPAATVRNQ